MTTEDRPWSGRGVKGVKVPQLCLYTRACVRDVSGKPGRSARAWRVVKGVKVYRNGARAGGVQRFRTFTPFTRRVSPQVRGKCASVLAAAARVVLGAVLVLTALAAVLWAAAGPQGLGTVAWLAAEFAVVSGAALGVAALQPKREGNER